MKASITNDEYILIEAESITEALAMENIMERNKNDVSKSVIIDGQILFRARNKAGKRKPLG